MENTTIVGKLTIKDIDFNNITIKNCEATGLPKFFKGSEFLFECGMSPTGMSYYSKQVSPENVTRIKDGTSGGSPYYLTIEGILELIEHLNSRKRKRKRRVEETETVSQQSIPLKHRCDRCGKEKLLSEFSRNAVGDLRCVCDECINNFKEKSTAEFIEVKKEMRNLFSGKINKILWVLGNIRRCEKDIVNKEYTPKGLLKLIENEEDLDFLSEFRDKIQKIIDERGAFGEDLTLPADTGN